MVFFHIHTQEYTHTHSNIWVLILPFQRKIQCVRFNRMPNYRFLQWVRRGGPEYACASVREREEAGGSTKPSFSCQHIVYCFHKQNKSIVGFFLPFSAQYSGGSGYYYCDYFIITVVIVVVFAILRSCFEYFLVILDSRVISAFLIGMAHYPIE